MFRVMEIRENRATKEDTKLNKTACIRVTINNYLLHPIAKPLDLSKETIEILEYDQDDVKVVETDWVYTEEDLKDIFPYILNTSFLEKFQMIDTFATASNMVFPRDSVMNINRLVVEFVCTVLNLAMQNKPLAIEYKKPKAYSGWMHIAIEEGLPYYGDAGEVFNNIIKEEF